MKINFNRKNINFISFFVFFLIFIVIIFILNLIKTSQNNIQYSLKDNTNIYQNENNKTNLDENTYLDLQQANLDISLSEVSNWKIEIEKLNILADIKDGTSTNILEKSVGHYTNTNILNGKIALKAYNTGHNNNYFANLKELEIGDEIKYMVNENEKIFKVVSNKIINSAKQVEEKEELEGINKEINEEIKQSDNEEEYNLEKNDILILITYVKDMPNKFRCVIAENQLTFYL